MNRRDFAKTASAAAALALASRLAPGARAQTQPPAPKPLSVHIFSKHLQFLGYDEMAERAAEIGFDGVDLSVRPKGHVEPANVAGELPQAVAAIKARGLAADMMVTSITVLDDTAKRVLETAAAQGIQYYRLGYFAYPAAGSWKECLDRHKDELAKIAAFNQSLGIYGAYQNHAGTRVGAYLPDLAYLCDGLDPRWIGVQYDIRHATVEGGNAWPVGLRFVKDYIRTAVIKDFLWTESEKSWKPENVAFGHGMVDFKAYFAKLREYRLDPVFSLHLEYPIGGAEHGARAINIPQHQVFAAMRTDLHNLRARWAETA